MSEQNEVAEALKEVAHKLGELGNGDALTYGMGAIEGHAVKMTETGSEIAAALNRIADGLIEVASAIDKAQ